MVYVRSNNGTVNNSIRQRNDPSSARLEVSSNADNNSPRQNDPTSPMKMRAGGTLNNKNPIVLPVKASDATPRTALPCCQATTAKQNPMIAHTPGANPSITSMKLIAFMIATHTTTLRLLSRTAESKTLSPPVPFTTRTAAMH